MKGLLLSVVEEFNAKNVGNEVVSVYNGISGWFEPIVDIGSRCHSTFIINNKIYAKSKDESVHVLFLDGRSLKSYITLEKGDSITGRYPIVKRGEDVRYIVINEDIKEYDMDRVLINDKQMLAHVSKDGKLRVYYSYKKNFKYDPIVCVDVDHAYMVRGNLVGVKDGISTLYSISVSGDVEIPYVTCRPTSITSTKRLSYTLGSPHHNIKYISNFKDSKDIELINTNGDIFTISGDNASIVSIYEYGQICIVVESDGKLFVVDDELNLIPLELELPIRYQREELKEYYKVFKEIFDNKELSNNEYIYLMNSLSNISGIIENINTDKLEDILEIFGIEDTILNEVLERFKRIESKHDSVPIWFVERVYSK